MPIYDIVCNKCGKLTEVFRKLADIDDLPACCGTKMERVISAPQVIADIQPYKSMATGEMITSRTQHKKHLKEHGLIEVGNETMQPKKSYLEEKRQKDALRREIAARIDSIRGKNGK